MLDFRMETFLTVCNDMNFTHAAEHLNLTQPAVSQHIKHLEKTYGTELFIRDKKKLRLTPAGEILRSALETMRNDENTLKKRMQESIEGKKVLTFGVTMTIGEYAIVPALSRFIKTHPDMDLFQIRASEKAILAFFCSSIRCFSSSFFSACTLCTGISGRILRIWSSSASTCSSLLKIHCFSSPPSYCTTTYGIVANIPFPEKPPLLMATLLNTLDTESRAT